MNRIFLIGRLTNDPEVRFTEKGKARTSFCLAVDRLTKNANGEKETDFFNILMWGKQAELCGEYLHKGERTVIYGTLRLEKYEDKDGIKRTAVKVWGDGMEFLSYGKKSYSNNNSMTDTAKEDFAEEIPF